MSLKSFFAKIFAKKIYQKTQFWAVNPIETQRNVFEYLIRQAKNTTFGIDHHFSQIKTFEDFTQNVPVRDYEELKPYIDSVVKGEENILWRGKPLYFAKTSGTTSGAKYIPLTKESMPFHIEAARNAILHYIHETGKADFLDGKMIFLQGSPIMEEKNGIKLGRLSGIAAHFVPKYLQKNRMPSWETNCIEDWETKIISIVEETFDQNMTVISGIPSWVQMYFEKLHQKGENPSEKFSKSSIYLFTEGLITSPTAPNLKTLLDEKWTVSNCFRPRKGFLPTKIPKKKKECCFC